MPTVSIQAGAVHVGKMFPGWRPLEISASALRRCFLAFARAYHPDKLLHAGREDTVCFQQVSDWYDAASGAATDSVTGSVTLRWHVPAPAPQGDTAFEICLIPDPEQPEFVAEGIVPKLVEISQFQRGNPRKFWRTGFSTWREVQCSLLVDAKEVPFVRCMTSANGTAFRMALHVRQKGPGEARELLQIHAEAQSKGGSLHVAGYFVWGHNGEFSLRDTNLGCTRMEGSHDAKNKCMELSDGTQHIRLEALVPEDPKLGRFVAFINARSQVRSFWRLDETTRKRKR